MELPSRLLTLALSSAVFGGVLGAQSPVGVFTTDTNVGRASGSASYDPQQQTYLVAGSGQNMWDTRDDFHFVWKRISGNFTLSTRARFIGSGLEEHRKIGWTIRPSLEPGSAHVTAALHGNGLMSLQFRRQTGAITEEEKSADSLPGADAIIRLERRDGVYYMSVAQLGDTLVTQRLTGVLLPDTVYVGLFVCSHNAAVTERATFRDVRITTPAGQASSLIEHDTIVAAQQPGPHGGGGLTTAYSFFAGAPNLQLVFRKRALHHGAAIGYHRQDEDEIYYVVSGTGALTLNGQRSVVGAGTAILTRTGSSHGIQQVGSDDLVIIIVYQQSNDARRP